MGKARSKKRGKRAARTQEEVASDLGISPNVLAAALPSTSRKDLDSSPTSVNELEVLRNSVGELAQALEMTAEAGSALEKQFKAFREQMSGENADLHNYIRKLEATFGLPGPEGDDDDETLPLAQGDGETHRPGNLSPEAQAGESGQP